MKEFLTALLKADLLDALLSSKQCVRVLEQTEEKTRIIAFVCEAIEQKLEEITNDKSNSMY